MGPEALHLPDGQNFVVHPVFAGVGFKSNELNTHHNPFPVGWTCVLHTEKDVPAPPNSKHNDGESNDDDENNDKTPMPTRKHISPYRSPTRQGDTLFISSISNPSSSEFKPAASPTRQIAMMLWVTLYWYFHQPEPKNPFTSESEDWRIWIKRDGVLRGRNLIPKLERMGLVASADTAVGTSLDDSGQSWERMFVSKHMFWQIPGRLFLFTLQPLKAMSTFPSPATSRPGSPTRGVSAALDRSASPLPGGPSHQRMESDLPGAPVPTTMPMVPNVPVGPYFSSSHLPTYYPPAPMQYVNTRGVRHPLRPKPPRMGEVFYTRFVPSVGKYISLRVASLSQNAVPHLGPLGPNPPGEGQQQLCGLSDAALLQKWSERPGLQDEWGAYKPTWIKEALCQSHSFPAIGLWDGVPFGCFQIFWVKEDELGSVSRDVHSVGDWDRGIRALVTEDWAKGQETVWLSALVHWCYCVDYRTMDVYVSPDARSNDFQQQAGECGFEKVNDVSVRGSKLVLMRQRREAWDGPVL